MSEWRCFDDRAALDHALAERIASRLSGDIDTRGAASLAVSGGSTPKQMFRLLGQKALDWSRVWLTLVDERWVAPDSPDSNERLVRENLLQGAAQAAHFIGLMCGGDDPVAAVGEIEQRLEALPRPFSCVVLGMGGDGHTASWFPRAENLPQLLDPQAGATVAATEPVTAPHSRMTLTLPAVLDSGEIILHITGDEKRSVLEEAVAQGYPVAAILEQSKTPASTWWAP